MLSRAIHSFAGKANFYLTLGIFPAVRCIFTFLLRNSIKTTHAARRLLPQEKFPSPPLWTKRHENVNKLWYPYVLGIPVLGSFFFYMIFIIMWYISPKTRLYLFDQFYVLTPDGLMKMVMPEENSVVASLINQRFPNTRKRRSI